MSIRGILLDLDGTLADTAPDLVAVLNTLLHEEGRPPMPYAIARNVVSNGAVGLLRLGFGLDTEAPVDEDLRQRFLDLYARNICVRTQLFVSARSLTSFTAGAGARWGIVTNKPAAFTHALLEALEIADQPACVVSGDTVRQKKPHPAPLQHAAALLRFAPEECVYIGDSSRDVAAGQAAGMCTIAAAYGYIPPLERVTDWGAEVLVKHPGALFGILESLIRSAPAHESRPQ